MTFEAKNSINEWKRLVSSYSSSAAAISDNLGEIMKKIDPRSTQFKRTKGLIGKIIN